MSRIGKLPIELPEGVSVKITPENVVIVKGPLGELSRTIDEKIKVNLEGNVLTVEPKDNKKETKSLFGLSRTLIANMVLGVTKEFEVFLIAQGVGYRAVKEGNKVILRVGYSHPVEVIEPEGVKIEILPSSKNSNMVEMVVKGIDKEKVGQCAANIKAIRKPDPYHIYGIRYRDEVIQKKEGKSAATS